MVEMNQMDNMGAAVPDYTNYVNHMLSLGYSRSQQTLNEKNAKIVTLTGGAANTTIAAIDIRTPAGQKMSIMGKSQIPRGADGRSAYALRVRLAGTADTEISQYTSIRITKEGFNEDVKQLARMMYADVSMVKQKVVTGGGAGTPAGDLLKDDSLWYRFPQGIEFNGEEHMVLYVVAENPTGGPNLPDIPIEATHIKFTLEVDFWSI